MLLWLPALVVAWFSAGTLVAVPFLLFAAGRVVMHCVLASLDGGRINAAVAPFAAEPVEVRGRLLRRGDLHVLRIDPADIRRQ